MYKINLKERTSRDFGFFENACEIVKRFRGTWLVQNSQLVNTNSIKHV